MKNKELEIAKRLLESKGYEVSKIEEGYSHSGHDVSGDTQQYLVTIVIGGSDGDAESGMTEPDFYTELVSAMDEDDARRQVEKGLDTGDGITDIHLATEEEIADWNDDAYAHMDEGAYSEQQIDEDPGASEQGRYPAPRRGRKPNGDEKDDGVFTPGSEEERDHNLHESIIKALNKLHESTEGLDYDEMKYWNPVAIGSKVAKYLGVDATEEEIESEIEKILDRDDSKFQRAVDKALREIEMERDMTDQDPMKGHKYVISGATPNVTETGTDYNQYDGGYKENPKDAIITWLQLSQEAPTAISIDTNKNAYADELLKWVVDNEEEFRSLCAEYKCPYKVDYLVDACKKGRASYKDFEKSKYNYPDQIHPFAIG